MGSAAAYPYRFIPPASPIGSGCVNRLSLESYAAKERSASAPAHLSRTRVGADGRERPQLNAQVRLLSFCLLHSLGTPERKDSLQPRAFAVSSDCCVEAHRVASDAIYQE